MESERQYTPETETNNEKKEWLEKAIEALTRTGDDPSFQNAMFDLSRAGEAELLNEVFRFSLRFAKKYIDKAQQKAAEDMQHRLYELENGIGHRSTHFANHFLGDLPHNPEDPSFDPETESLGRLLCKLAASNYQAQGQYPQAINYYRDLGQTEIAAQLEQELNRSRHIGGRVQERSDEQMQRDTRALDEALQEWNETMADYPPPMATEDIVAKIQEKIDQLT